MRFGSVSFGLRRPVGWWGRRCRPNLRTTGAALQTGDLVAQLLILGAQTREFGVLGFDEAQQLHDDHALGGVGDGAQVDIGRLLTSPTSAQPARMSTRLD
jgi:hypothetical protein